MINVYPFNRKLTKEAKELLESYKENQFLVGKGPQMWCAVSRDGKFWLDVRGKRITRYYDNAAEIDFLKKLCKAVNPHMFRKNNIIAEWTIIDGMLTLFPKKRKVFEREEKIEIMEIPKEYEKLTKETILDMERGRCYLNCCESFSHNPIYYLNYFGCPICGEIGFELNFESGESGELNLNWVN